MPGLYDLVGSFSHGTPLSSIRTLQARQSGAWRLRRSGRGGSAGRFRRRSAGSRRSGRGTGAGGTRCLIQLHRGKLRSAFGTRLRRYRLACPTGRALLGLGARRFGSLDLGLRWSVAHLLNLVSFSLSDGTASRGRIGTGRTPPSVATRPSGLPQWHPWLRRRCDPWWQGPLPCRPPARRSPRGWRRPRGPARLRAPNALRRE